MSEQDISGTTEINDEGIKKHFDRIEPWEAISELVWNGFDAGATNVRISIEQNGMDATEKISILDDGEGIDYLRIKDSFGRFNDSAKKGNLSQHGRHGRGRLAFYRLCHRAIWYTKNSHGCASVTISSSNIKKYDGKAGINPDTIPPDLKPLPTGTSVVLESFSENLPENGRLRDMLSVKSRLVINALLEQFRFFLLPFFQRLNGRKMVERTLRNLLVVSVHIALKRCLQLSR